MSFCYFHHFHEKETTESESVKVFFEGDISNSSDFEIFDEKSLTEIIKKAYLAGDSTFFSRIKGSYSFVIFDIKRNSFFAQRDHFGTVPLYYVYETGKLFGFSSNLPNLLLKIKKPKPNLSQIIDYLTPKHDYEDFMGETFFENVYSLEPAHQLIISENSLQKKSNWRIDLQPFEKFSGIADFGKAFKDLFFCTIKTKINQKTIIGSHLSGGLDSSSLVCVTNQIKNKDAQIHTFYINTKQKLANEAHFVADVVADCQQKHHEFGPVEDTFAIVWQMIGVSGHPEQAILPSSFHQPVLENASKLGCQILLNGHDGDSVVSHGNDYLTILWQKKELVQLRKALFQYATLRNTKTEAIGLSDYQKYEKFALGFLAKEANAMIKSFDFVGFWQFIRQIHQSFEISNAAIVGYYLTIIKNKFSLKNKAVEKVFVANLATKKREPRPTIFDLNTLSAEQKRHFRSAIQTNYIFINEQIYHQSQYFGIKTVFPFFDKDLFELCIAAPLEIKFGEGLGRGIMREAMKQILPESVRTRSTKANFVEFNWQAVDNLYQASREILLNNEWIWSIVDKKEFDKIVENFYDNDLKPQQKFISIWYLSRIIYLTIWHEQFIK